MLFRTFSLAVGLIGAVMGSQLPEIVQQYRQRLGGAIDEVSGIVARFDADAAANRLSRNDALAQLAKSPDDLVRRRGHDVELNVERLDALEEQRVVMDSSDSIVRMAHFLAGADTALLEATLRDYRRAIPTTGEGLFSGGVGFVAGWSLMHLIGWPFNRWREQRRKRVP